MKKVLPLIVLSILPFLLKAQIELDVSHVVVSGDEAIFHVAKPISYNLDEVGENMEWDFSGLQSVEVKKFKYKAPDDKIYDNLIGFDKGSVDVSGPFDVATIIPQDQLPGGITMSEGEMFFKLKGNQFCNVGYLVYYDIERYFLGLQFQEADVVLDFPLTYQKEFSSHAKLEKKAMPMYKIIIDRERNTVVDSYGNLKTPMGTYECLRLKSTINEKDEFHAYAQNINIDENQQYYEYTWMAKGFHTPILKIIKSEKGTIIYYLDDKSNDDDKGITEISPYMNNAISISPNPMVNDLTMSVSSIINLQEVSVYDINGRMVNNQEISNRMEAGQRITILEKSHGLDSGIYFVKVLAKEGVVTRKLIIP
ncbi:MAG: T9SS type A sorting domain-containing protein [Bacteroidales bacterium]